jgi:oligopeptide/dipeptide ABC transporter ATP-binding protein
MRELLRVDSLVKYFPIEKQVFIAAVNDVSFAIGRGETLGLVGESGSGKTTVGRCVLRLLEPTGGAIFFKDREITKLKDRELRELRPRMQIVFQEPFASLNPRRTVRQTVEEPLHLEGQLSADQITARVGESLQAVHLSNRHLSRYPAQLTASEQQRVGIARAIATHPDLVVLDEPTSTLDQSVRAEILDVLIELQQRFEMSYLLISHDLTAVERVSHRIAIMYLGKIVETGTTEQIFARQFHPYSRALLSAVLYPDPRRKLDPFMLEGEIPSPINPRDECSLLGRCPISQDSCALAFPPLEPVEPGRLAACYRWREFVTDMVEPSDDRADSSKEAVPVRDLCEERRTM